MKACDGDGGIIALFLNLNTKGSYIIYYTFQPLYPIVPIDRRVDWPRASPQILEKRRL